MLLAAANAPLVLDFFFDLLLFVAHDHLELHRVNAGTHEAAAMVPEVPVHEQLLVRDKAVAAELRAVTGHEDGRVVHVLSQVVVVVHDERNEHLLRVKRIEHGRSTVPSAEICARSRSCGTNRSPSCTSCPRAPSFSMSSLVVELGM